MLVQKFFNKIQGVQRLTEDQNFIANSNRLLQNCEKDFHFGCMLNIAWGVSYSQINTENEAW